MKAAPARRTGASSRFVTAGLNETVAAFLAIVSGGRF
jgi:hypothetical protein